MTPDHVKPAEDLERFRDFLSLLVRLQAGSRWQGKIDLSGVVQQTLLEGFQAEAKLQGTTEAQKAAWLKQVLANNLGDEIRKLTTARRDAGRERSLEAAMNDSLSHLEQLLPAEQATPSQMWRVRNAWCIWRRHWQPFRNSSGKRSRCITCRGKVWRR